MEVLPTKNNTVTLQFSTGAFVAVVSELVKAWKGTQGKLIDTTYTGGLSVRVTSVKPKKEIGGKAPQTTTRLQVDGEQITITTYDTKTKMNVQGKSPEQYCSRSLLPYLRAELDKAAATIFKYNDFFSNLSLIHI